MDTVAATKAAYTEATRNLMYIAEPIGAERFCESAADCCEAYNDFDAGRVVAVVRTLQARGLDMAVSFCREGSPSLYIVSKNAPIAEDADVLAELQTLSASVSVYPKTGEVDLDDWKQWAPKQAANTLRCMAWLFFDMIESRGDAAFTASTECDDVKGYKTKMRHLIELNQKWDIAYLHWS